MKCTTNSKLSDLIVSSAKTPNLNCWECACELVKKSGLGSPEVVEHLCKHSE